MGEKANKTGQTGLSPWQTNIFVVLEIRFLPVLPSWDSYHALLTVDWKILQYLASLKVMTSFPSIDVCRFMAFCQPLEVVIQAFSFSCMKARKV